MSFPKAQALTPSKYVPVTVDWMNYSTVIVGATIVFPGAYFVFSARHKYIKESNTVLEENVVVVDGIARHGAEVVLEK